MIDFKRTKNVLVVSVCALALGACASPNFWPDGYTHHGKLYKSEAPGPSPKFTKEMRASMGPEQADQFRLSVYSLVEKLTARAGIPPKPAHVVKPEKMTPLHANIDNDLRESLRHMGYRMSDTPDGAYAFAYSAAVIKDANGNPVPADGVTPNVRIALYVYDSVGEGSRLLTQEIGDFHIKGAETLNIPMTDFPGLAVPSLNARTGAESE